MTPSKNRLAETILPNAPYHVGHDRPLAHVMLGDRQICPLPMGDGADMSSHQSMAGCGEMLGLSPGKAALRAPTRTTAPVVHLIGARTGEEYPAWNSVRSGDTAASSLLPDTGWEATEAS